MTNINLTRRSFIGASAFALASASFAAWGLAGCSDGGSSSSASSAASTAGASAADTAPNPIIVAILAREEPDVGFVAGLLSDKYTVQSQVFGDNNAINEATLDGSVQVNFFQNQSYLDSWNESKGTDLVPYGDAIFSTVDILVSKKAKTIDELPEGATVLVANDNANRARELQLLADNGLIKLDESVDLPTVLDITENPKNIEIIEVDPRSRVGAFPDVDAMVAPSITVFQMGDADLSVETALAVETPEVYKKYGGTSLVVTRETADANPQWLQDLAEAFQTKDYADFIKETYQGAKVSLKYVS